MKGKKLLNTFQAEACNTAIYILNCIFTKAMKGMTPLQDLSDMKPSAAHFRIFGCDCFVHVPNANMTKWEPNVQKCIFLGYNEEAKGYFLYNPATKKIIVSHDVVFSEQPHQLEEDVSFLDNQDEDIHQVQPLVSNQTPPTVLGRIQDDKEEEEDKPP